MRHLSLIACVLLLAAIAAQGQASSSTTAIKSVPSFDLNAMDKTADPCVDFYQYACGNWVKNNPIPADQPEWGRFNELHERNQLILRSILDKTSADNPGRSSTDQKIGDYYHSCMDEAGIDAKGTAPLKPMLDRIAALQDKSQLPALIGELHNNGVPRAVRFRLRAGCQRLHDGNCRHRPGWTRSSRSRLLPEDGREVESSCATSMCST